MERRGLEPGLLSIFRVYVVLRFVAVLAVAEFFFLRYGPWFQLIKLPYIVLFLANFVILLVALSIPWIREKLGTMFLPVALIVAALGPILEARYLFVVYDPAYEARFWLVFPFLAIPVILMAWQYQFRHVVAFCVATALFEAALIVVSPVQTDVGVMSDVGYLVVRTVFLVLMGYIVSHLMVEQREQRRALAEANRKLVRYAATLEQLAVSEERNRLARELHDTLAHTLSALAVQLDAIGTVWVQMPPKARTMLQRALAITRTGLDDTRRVLGALRATPLEDRGLVEAVRRLAEGAAARGGLELELHLEEQSIAFAPEVEQCYYRVAQEAIENVLRHAEAATLSVSLTRADGQLVLEVSDDGRGSLDQAEEEAETASQAVQQAHETTPDLDQDAFGIRGMHERAELIGATLKIESQTDAGTTVRLSSEEGHWFAS
jgi:signal transduction histidine kinase